MTEIWHYQICNITNISIVLYNFFIILIRNKSFENDKPGINLGVGSIAGGGEIDTLS